MPLIGKVLHSQICPPGAIVVICLISAATVFPPLLNCAPAYRHSILGLRLL